MTAYRCLVLATGGRSDWRMIDAVDERSAISQLLADGLTPLDVRTGTPTLGERLNRPVRLRGGLTIGQQSLVLTQLATLIGSGLPVDRSLDLIREQATSAAQRDLLARAVARVRSGGSLAASFEEIGGFPPYVVGVLRSAERGGGLGQAMASVAERLTLAADMRAQLITALSYPMAVLVATILALSLVLTQVVPQFAPLFEGEEAKLPQLTRMVLWLSAMVQAHAMLLAGLLLLPPMLLFATRSRLSIPPRIRRFIPGAKLRDDYLAAQFTGVLGTLIANGVTAVAALPLARAATGSSRWRQGLGEVEQRVREGMRISAALARHSLIPSTAIRLIEVGERTGSLANSCLQASAIIARSAKARIDRIVALANPLAIFVLGGLVGSLVAGVMLGIFALGDFAG